MVVLPASNAEIIKNRLESKGIECDLEALSLLDESPSTVRVKVLEKDIHDALPLLEDFMSSRSEPSGSDAEEKGHILVPVDFSPGTIQAGKLAFNIAQRLQARMIFMHCYINPIIHSVPYADVYVYDAALLARMESTEKEANENFTAFIRQLSAEIGKERWNQVNSEFIIKPGYADEDILAYAHQNHSKLIVMGTGSNTSMAVGSVTADIIYNAKVPVLVVPAEAQQNDLPEFKRAVYATNFDDKDFQAINKLISILKPFQVRLYCVHISKEERTDWDKARLEGMKNILTERYAEKAFECRMLIGDDLLETLDNFIREEQIDIISLTTHKRNMISRLFNPSVARKMVFHAKTPLLIFHA